MARLTTLANLRLLFKGEMGWSLNTAVNSSQDQEINYCLMNEQNRLAGEYDWSFLRLLSDVACPASSQYLTLPLMNYERAESLLVEVFYNNKYIPLFFGIGSNELNISNVALSQFQNPVQRWDLYNQLQFQVWPVGSVDQTIRFTGQKIITPFAVAGTFDDNVKADLDDLLIVYFACATMLARRKDASAPIMLQKANKRLAQVRASYPKRQQTTIMHKSCDDDDMLRKMRTIPIVVTAPHN